ncbi:chemotaxis protein CheA [Sinirhodobacter populi]|uniref:Chemotaxis protein CheA n=1 Tax=Paenirhodobacter populi TaxID=2306993 RepID=A0A443KQR6_9RHOB|nr:chemotaxis protein CheA [Sinirhodobacter populi]RWR35260.1 chemotaxis protein CheA [Sinirhodobacter populi]
MPQDPLAEIRAGFFLECEELLETLRDGLAALAADTTDRTRIDTIFRAVHSIKGGAGAFGLDRLVGFAHRYEAALDLLRTGRAPLTEALLRLLDRAGDALEDHVQAAQRGDRPPAERESILAELQRQLDPFMREDAAPKPQAASWELGFTPHGALYDNGHEPLYLLRALRELGARDVICAADVGGGLIAFDPARPALRWTLTLPAETAEADMREIFCFVEDLCTLTISRARAGPAPGETGPVPTVRVDLDRIERLMNLVGELVINQAMLAQSVTDSGAQPNSPVMTGLESFTKLTREIQESVMMIRAQPVKPLFQRMSRVVRETAASTGKQVRLVALGEATEIDRTVIERLAEPLTHLIRNAVDHGIEPPEVRSGLGKPACGTITLTAQHQSGRLMIELRDDGAGIDRDKVLTIAVRRGLVPAGSPPPDSEIDALLFSPGFSTVTEISALSGRGVGLDAVRTAILGLGGRIGIRSRPGEGTVFTVSLPLTLAVLDGMIVRVGEETLVIPLSAVVETAALSAQNVRAIGAGHTVLELRGGFLPLFDLGAELGFRAPRRHDDGGIVLLTRHEDESRSALIVDAILEQRQVVIKGLHGGCGPIHGISAATILGDGRVALIVDPTDLLSRRHLSPHDMAMAG